MTKDDIVSRIGAAEAELADVRRDIINGPQNDVRSQELLGRRDELVTEIAGLKAMLDEL